MCLIDTLCKPPSAKLALFWPRFWLTMWAPVHIKTRVASTDWATPANGSRQNRTFGEFESWPKNQARSILLRIWHICRPLAWVYRRQPSRSDRQSMEKSKAVERYPLGCGKGSQTYSRMYHLKITVTQCLMEHLDEWKRCEHVNIVPFLGLLHREGNIPSLVIPYYKDTDVLSYLRHNPTADKLLLVSNYLMFSVISADVQVADRRFGFWYYLFTRPWDNTW